MPVRFLIGRAGSGKTHQCLHEIAAACAADPLGAPMIYLVPEQATYLSERALLSTGLIRGYCRAQVLSFTRLASYLFSQSPAPGRPRLTATHRSLIATMLVSRKRRQSDAALLNAVGLEEALDALISETKQYAIDADALRAAAARIAESGVLSRDPAAGMLGTKLLTLAEMLDDFRGIVGERFEDPQDTLASLHDAIVKGDLLQGAHVYIDGFIGFTPVEERLVAALGRKAALLTIALPGEPGRAQTILSGGRTPRHAVYTPAEETLERLYSLFLRNAVEMEKPVLLSPELPPRFASPELAAVEANFLSRRPKPQAATPQAIEFWEAENAMDEARFAAETIARWRADNGWDYEEMAILARDLDTYAQPLEESLRTLRIPHFIDRSLPLETHPIVNGMRALIRASLHGERTEHLIELGKSGLLPVERPLVDALEAHVKQYPRTREEWHSREPWAARPSRSPFAGEEQIEEKSILPERIDTARRAIAGAVRSFRNAYAKESHREGKLNAFLQALADAVDTAIRDRTIDPADERILERIEEILSEVGEIAGDEVFPWEFTGDLVMRALGGLSLPRIPPQLDQVLVGQIDRSRQPALKGVILLGLNEGQFPRVVSNMSLLNDGERILLGDAGLEVRPDSRRLFERESLLAYRALSTASSRLALVRSRTHADGSPTSPSPYWEELLRLFPATQVQRPASRDEPARAWRARELAAAALRKIDESHAQLVEHAAGIDLLRPLQGSDLWPEVAAVRGAALWRNEARIDSARLRDMLEGKLSLSASQLESFARCPFQHFTRYMLRPMELLVPEFEHRDIGNFCHAVLRNFTQFARERKLLGMVPDDTVFDSLFADALAPPLARIQTGGLLTAASSRLLIEKVTDHLRDLARWLIDMTATIPHQPAFEERRIGGHADDSLPPLAFASIAPGWDLELKGQIDRIDILASADSEQAICFDYKLRGKNFDYAAWHVGENLQLPLYLVALQRATGVEPAAGLYIQILSPDLNREDRKPRKFVGIARASLYDMLPGQDAPWGRRAPIQGAQSDPHGEPGNWGTAVTDEQFDLMLQQTERMLAELATQIISGDAAVEPSRRGNLTPCSYCDYRGVCGVDFRINRPRRRVALSRREILQGLAQE